MPLLTVCQMVEDKFVFNSTKNGGPEVGHATRKPLLRFVTANCGATNPPTNVVTFTGAELAVPSRALTVHFKKSPRLEILCGIASANAAFVTSRIVTPFNCHW